jgi:peptidoglycan hydrolase CwlO-like protein
MAKKIMLALLVILIIIQFIRPEKNVSAEIVTDRDLSKVHPVPENVHQLLIKKCYDCHSNNTVYPWYNNIQPVAWWLANHVNEGKGELNFSEFSTYDKKKADHKLEELAEVVEDGSMPLKSYTLLHPETKVSEDERKTIIGWVNTLDIVREEHQH